MRQLKKETKIKLLKTGLILAVIVVIVLAIYLPLKLSGALAKIDSAEKLQQIIQQGGAYSYLIFIVIQFLQVTFIPLPAAITTVAGVLAFENIWLVFGLSLFAVLLGSVFAYFLGYKIGRKLVFWVVGQKDAIKWEMKLKRGKYVFFLMMLFPLFPDDILCIVAGCIGMKFKFFLVTNIITRPIVILLTCLFGSGSIIPFSGWGIPVWIVLVILGIIAFYISYKYQAKIENIIYRISCRLTGKKIVEQKSSLPTTMILSQNSIKNKNIKKHSIYDVRIKNHDKMFSLYTDTEDKLIKKMPKSENEKDEKVNIEKIEKTSEISGEINISENDIDKYKKLKK